MENSQEQYIKTDNNTILNEKHIKWVYKMNDCLEVCMKSSGCTKNHDTHRICKLNSLNSYNKLNKQFE